MHKLLGWLDKNGVVEEEDVPWGALMVLSTKPHQYFFHGMGINGERVYPIENQTGSINVVKEIDNKKKYFMKLIWKVVIGKW